MDEATFWNARGIQLQENCHYHAASAAFMHGLQIQRRADILANQANNLRMLQDFEPAVELIGESLKAKPTRGRSLWIKGMVAMDMGDLPFAIELLTAAMSFQPTLAQIQFTRACANLKAGNYLAGFTDYETRGKIRPPIKSEIAPWQGENLAGKTLLVDMEQGMGDAIMFARYVDRIEGDVICRVPSPLLRWFRGQGYMATPKANAVRADYRALSMSLPVILGIDEAIKPKTPTRPEQMSIPKKGKFKIGIVWKSKAQGLEEPEALYHGEQKSCPLERFLTLAEIPGVQLFSLQTGPAAQDIERAAGIVEPLLIFDFEDLAGYISGLDMVISVDTGPLHLAGALGAPSIGVLPYVGSWQWGIGDRPAWYDNMIMVRQPKPGDWKGAMAQVSAIVEAACGP